MEAASETRAYRQVARARAQEGTREALLDAADSEFFSGRWEQASLEALATDAGVTKQTLLRHFGSKDGLLEHAIVRASRVVRDQRWEAPSGDIAGAVDNLLDHYEQWGEQSLRVGALDAGGPLIVDLGQRARALHYEWVEYAFGSWLKGVRGRRRARRRAALIAICDVHTWRLLSHDLGFSRSEVRATLIQAIEDLIQEEK